MVVVNLTCEIVLQASRDSRTHHYFSPEYGFLPQLTKSFSNYHLETTSCFIFLSAYINNGLVLYFLKFIQTHKKGFFLLQWYLSGITTSDVLKKKENTRTFSTCKIHVDVLGILKVHKSIKVMSEEHD